MSPASYRAAPPRVGVSKDYRAPAVECKLIAQHGNLDQRGRPGRHGEPDRGRKAPPLRRTGSARESPPDVEGPHGLGEPAQRRRTGSPRRSGPSVSVAGTGFEPAT